jgi:uncharacterized OB-fold protein
MQIKPYEKIYYDFKDGRPYLIGSQCKKCGYVAFPKRTVCPACVTNGSMVDIELSPRGKVDTFSTLHVAPPGFPVPYTVGYVSLPEGPRIFSILSGSGEAIDIGDDAEIIVGKIREDEMGNEVIGYQFKVRGSGRKG